MASLRKFWGSFVGKKLIAAATGLILLLFLLGHMAGNLKVLLGADASGVPDIDVYGKFLRSMGEPLIPQGFALWTARVVLLVSLLVHVVVVIQLALANRSARQIPYTVYRTRASSFAAKTMLWSGFAVLAFVIFHVLHLTTGTIRFGSFLPGSVYANLFYSFRQPAAAVLYMLVMLAVGLHVLHGGWSFFQTWGIDNPARNRGLRRASLVIAVLLTLGFCLVPFLFMIGALPDPSTLVRLPRVGD